MPCNAILYLPARVTEMYVTDLFAGPEATNATTALLQATLAPLLGHQNYSVTNAGSNITVWLPNGTLRIWNDGRVVVRLEAYTSNAEALTATLNQAVQMVVASMNQLRVVKAIMEAVPVSEVNMDLNGNYILTANIQETPR